ncbi:hypothetical protein GN244_ATG09973 [Phytophthora infestans]|uniref:Uncharacterized protein n=1 Tax=Phytophthora infestans TaxID=4787 RepID=A0A833SS69_PHYIN|nr:hypothetical protein GN244_ATG09973 [Phytophthora infestans]KAF4150169.1 hypothetical protein GN958_ATG00590 [Phytophthora infestans]
MHEFEVVDNGEKKRESLVGKVIAWRANGGRYAWPVRFSDGEVIVMQCEELATALARSYTLGFDITNTPE